MSLKGERMGRGREEHFHLGIYTNYNGVCDSMNISLIKRPPDGHPNQGQAVAATLVCCGGCYTLQHLVYF